MNMNVLCVLVATTMLCVVQGGGRHHFGPKPMPKSCADIFNKHTKCVNDNKDKLQPPINFSMKDVKECIKKCPKPDRPGRHGGRRGWWQSLSEEDKAAMKTFKQCKHDGKKELMKPCVEEKIAGKFEMEEVDKSTNLLAAFAGMRKHHRGRHGRRHGGGRGHGKGHGGRGRRMRMLMMLKKKMSCSPEVETCLRGVLGDYFDKPIDALKNVCGVMEQCPKPEKTQECMDDKKVMKEAICDCMTDENMAAIVEKTKKCADALPDTLKERVQQHIARKADRMGEWMKRKCERDSDEDKSDEKKEHKLPRFCTKLEDLEELAGDNDADDE